MRQDNNQILQFLTSSLFLAGTICEITGAHMCCAVGSNLRQFAQDLEALAWPQCCAEHQLKLAESLISCSTAGTTAYLNRYHGRKKVMM